MRAHRRAFCGWMTAVLHLEQIKFQYCDALSSLPCLVLEFASLVAETAEDVSMIILYAYLLACIAKGQLLNGISWDLGVCSSRFLKEVMPSIAATQSRRACLQEASVRMALLHICLFAFFCLVLVCFGFGLFGLFGFFLHVWFFRLFVCFFPSTQYFTLRS